MDLLQTIIELGLAGYQISFRHNKDVKSLVIRLQNEKFRIDRCLDYREIEFSKINDTCFIEMEIEFMKRELEKGPTNAN